MEEEVAQGDGGITPDATSQQDEGQAESDSANENEAVEGESRAAVGKRSPKEPTKKQRDEHENTHMPYRSWCEDCVRSRARNSPRHKKAPEDPLEEIRVPRVHMDCFFV